MKIETKLNIGDAIFFILEKKVINSTIQGMKIQVSEKETEIIYLCNSEKDKQVNIKVDEKDSYKSKEDLIKSL